MGRLNDHLRRTFLAGIFAAIPIAVTIIIIWYIETKTRAAAGVIVGRNIPFLGVGLAIILIYLSGLVVTSLIGQFILGGVDRILSRLPLLRELYRVWKQVALTPGGSGGMFSKVVLIRDETGGMLMLGFNNGHAIPGDDHTTCVFVPASPNPMSGRLYFVPMDRCMILDLSVDEAFKIIVSGGNYLPDALGPIIRAHLPEFGGDSHSPGASLPGRIPSI